MVWKDAFGVRRKDCKIERLTLSCIILNTSKTLDRKHISEPIEKGYLPHSQSSCFGVGGPEETFYFRCPYSLFIILKPQAFVYTLSYLNCFVIKKGSIKVSYLII